ncbi:MAG TPA: hypothetical protein VEB19_15305 [Gemmatimonadaceae bacterium]|nr:hypothetical protein [Gemmatimonadaceae bacterium]
MEDKDIVGRRGFIRSASGLVLAGAFGRWPIGMSGVVFHSDWSSGRGRASTAIRDASKKRPWQIYIGGQERGQAVACSVVDGRALGFPTANCLQVDCIVGVPHNDMQEFHTGQVSNLPGGNAWPIPQVGESLYYRVYKRLAYPHHVTEPPPTGNNNHCLEERSGSRTNWSWTFYTAAEGWNPTFNVWVAGLPTRFALGGMRPIRLARDRVYRLEWAVHRVSVDRRRHEARIYDGDDRLLHSTREFSTGRMSLDGFTAPMNPTQLDGLQLGTNGMGFNPPNEPRRSVIPAWFFAGVAVSNGGWCGAYRNGV